MMTFYSAVGSYKFITEKGRKMPYILRMGRLEPVSIPEFFVWSQLLWEVETYDELRHNYLLFANKLGVQLPGLDQSLTMLVRRKLVAKGIGYTGEDALYDMLSSAFVLPTHSVGGNRTMSAIRLLFARKITLREASRVLKPTCQTKAERQVMRLVRQTPLSVSELIRCIDYGVRNVRTPDKVIQAIYPDENDTQERVAVLSRQSDNRTRILEAVANLYLSHKVMLDLA